jgi:hypothetical protein
MYLNQNLLRLMNSLLRYVEIQNIKRITANWGLLSRLLLLLWPRLGLLLRLLLRLMFNGDSFVK